MYQENSYFIKEGWRCPQCQKILSPHINFCPYCSSNERVSPIINTPYIGDEWWREYLRTGDEPNPFPTVTLNGTVINCSEDNLSWRDWLDEMRAHNWGQEDK